MTIAKEGIALIKEFEGMHTRLAGGMVKPYYCPSRVATVGIGTTVWPDGRKVQITDAPITEARAEECLMLDLDRKYAPPVDRAITVPMHSLMRAAAVSLAYNIGTGAFGKSTALRMINQRRFSEVPRAFAMYRMGGGKVLGGLERRRKAEALMFLAGVKALQTGGGEVVDLPESAAAPAPPAQTASAWGRFLSLWRTAA